MSNTLFYKTYASTEIFPLELRSHITEWLFEVEEALKPKDTKRDVLNRFFGLGKPRELVHPVALIVYPRSDQKIADNTHLLPYMVLEDFQAIHKLTECLNIAGYSDISAITTDQYDRPRERRKNKLFLCLPRNKPAQDCLAELSDVLRFRVEGQECDGKSINKIIWKNDDADEIEVCSPQSAYLLAQRTGSAEWRDNPGKCHSVDFGILARFDNPEAKNNPDLVGLRKFFVFGIRGLGTWGVSWYLDHSFNELDSKVNEKGPIQLLLKVTYRDYRIHKVEDVSQKGQEFFSRENDKDEILARISGRVPPY